MAITTATEPQQETQSNRLTTFDRCDKCGAQAYVEVVLRSGNKLSFCNHDWTAVEAGIAPHVAKTTDERWKLTWNRHLGTENS